MKIHNILLILSILSLALLISIQIHIASFNNVYESIIQQHYTYYLGLTLNKWSFISLLSCCTLFLLATITKSRNHAKRI